MKPDLGLNDSDVIARRALHTTVFAQCFSPCGKYLAAANSYGNIAVYSLVAALAQDANDDTRKPIYSFKGSDQAIYCMVSTDTFLISGGAGNICAWKWSEILDKAAKVIWSLKVPQMKAYTMPEVNSMALSSTDSAVELFAGCGDNNVYMWDLESGQETGVLSGHEDYVHCVRMKNSGRECASASEDGSVRIWDCRGNREPVHILEPHKNEVTTRPEVGKWVGCLAFDSNEDWLVCGGGPHMAAWHLRSLSPMATFNTPGASQKFAMFHDDLLISGGSEPYVNHWFVNGTLKSKVPCSATSVFDVAVNTQTESNRVLCVTGSSSKIDVCTNFGYKAFSLSFAV